MKAYPSVKELPEPPDLAVIVTPAVAVPAIIGECVDKGVKAAIVISAGFKETGAAGVGGKTDHGTGPAWADADHWPELPRRDAPPDRVFNATFAGIRAARQCRVRQSERVLATAILDWSFRENVGFSSFVSIGSMLDVGWGDLITLLGNDPKTQSIVIYMESIGDARSFLSAAREVALSKPIIVIKAGPHRRRSEGGGVTYGSMTGER